MTILVSSSDRAEKILAEVVEKYGLDNSKGDFVLVEVRPETSLLIKATGMEFPFSRVSAPIQKVAIRFRSID